MNKGFYCICLLILAMSAQAQQTLPWLSIQQTSGHFVQQKHLKVLSRPFVSKGSYHYDKATGLSWHTEEPVANQLLINAQGIVEIQADGSQKTVTSDTSVGNLLLALFSGDQTLLSEQFSLTQTDDGVSMHPQTALLKKLFSHIDICQKESQSQQISLFEADGNRTDIKLIPDQQTDTTD
ncbi:outer membrane lipoprotein carrier protein LolA [Neptunicella sp. SCSIO 80796]|uniref:outer membrane lipoprotein carrier protein LolA n=1 Tax=Neptunicella plasticusilytica TaxID=3117012 RepID=UPI003A4E2ABB